MKSISFFGKSNGFILAGKMKVTVRVPNGRTLRRTEECKRRKEVKRQTKLNK